MNINEAWEELFYELKIIESLEKTPTFPISATQINTRKEARLMAKFDTHESLPSIFKQNGLNIIATSNGKYILFKDVDSKSFISLPDYKSIKPIKFKPSLDFDLETLSFSNSMSESGAIDYAHHSNLLYEYTGEKNLKLTTRGRFFSKEFDLELGQLGTIPIKSVQIEVDAGYEGQDQFLILEAKSSTRNTFNIRQLYYPHRHFQSKTTKKIRTTLLSFSNGIYYFTEIKFAQNYYDYEVIDTYAFEVVIEEPQTTLTLSEMLDQVPYTPAGIPVPQADDINKVIDLLTFLHNNPSDKFSIAEHFEFDDRQGDYYGNAAAYIGFAIKENMMFKLTDSGAQLLKIKNRDNRNNLVISAIVRTRLFHDLITLYRNQENQIAHQQITDRISKEGLSGSTPARRMGTVRTWLTWIIDNLSN